MNADNSKQINTELLYKDLTYRIRGVIMEVSNKYGKGFKELIYQNALAEQFDLMEIKYEREKRVSVYSVESGKVLGYYTPDFIVEEKVIVELKATEFTSQQNQEQGLFLFKSK